MRKSKNKAVTWFDQSMNWMGIFTLALAFVLLFLLYHTGRSLWLDEAFLAYSVSKRSLLDLAKTVLDRNQTAPILYLYIVKIITVLFGNSEFTLRIFSAISYVGLLACAYYLLGRVYKIVSPMLGVGFIATMSGLLYYANEFKPYMSDCFCIFLVLVLYDLYDRKILKQAVFVVLSMLLVWASSPVIFFLAAVYGYNFVQALKTRKVEKIRKAILSGGLVLVSFLVNYWYWLRPVALSPFMTSYWEESVFPLWITSLADLKRLIFLMQEFSASFCYGALLIYALACVGAVASILKREKQTIIILLGVVLTLFASSIGKYPFNSRLVLFFYPVLGLLTFLGIEALTSNLDKAKKSLSLILTLMVLFTNYASIGYLVEHNRYRAYNEANSLIDYVQEEIRDGEKLYVSAPASSVFLYRNGYDEKQIGKQTDPTTANVIIGRQWDMLSAAGQTEIQSLLEEDLYLLFTMNRPKPTKQVLRPLGENGYLELIRMDHQTPLYYCSQATQDVKSRAMLELRDQKSLSNGLQLTFAVTAGPKAYLKHEMGQKISLAVKEYPELVFELTPKTIAPGETIEQTIVLDWPGEAKQVSVSLRSESFWFDELKMEPVVVQREPLK
ncbi:glycosyltransferase family 39 protein [Clostridia bacterium]|nr:glycosyltransferase family 39 protein [Clostridia bacterium]